MKTLGISILISLHTNPTLKMENCNLTWSISGIDLSLFTVGNQSAADDALTIYSILQNAFGSDQFTLTLTDSNGGTDSILVTLTVNSVNDDPVIQNPSTIQGNAAWTAR